MVVRFFKIPIECRLWTAGSQFGSSNERDSNFLSGNRQQNETGEQQYQGS
jgi:hypothetical protein